MQDDAGGTSSVVYATRTPGELEAGARAGHQGLHFGSMSLSLS